MSEQDEVQRSFRQEAHELLEEMTRGLLAVERGAPEPDAVGRLFRMAHTLKGAARVVKEQRIAEVAHAIEDALSSLRASGEALPKEAASELLELVRTMADELRRLPPLEEKSASWGDSLERESLATVRVEVARLDELLEGLSEAAALLGVLRNEAEPLSEARRRLADLAELSRSAAKESGKKSGLFALAEELERMLFRLERQMSSHAQKLFARIGQLRASAHELRLVPAEVLFPTLELAVRDAGLLAGKGVDFVAQGGKTRVSGHVLSELRKALVHLIRNAVDHGIEPEADRIARKKPARGLVTLKVEQRGSQVAFTVSDDGGGVDRAAVLRAAIDQKRVSEEEAKGMGEEEVMALLFGAGFSTRTEVSALSGRGVGLDAVRETARRLGGEVRAFQKEGQGLSVEIRVPVSLTTIEAVRLSAGGRVWLLPLDAVAATDRVKAAALVRSGNELSLAFGDRAIPFRPLAALVGRSDEASPAVWSVAVVRSFGRHVAVGADRLLGIVEAMWRPLPPSAGHSPLVLGASLDGQGVPELLLHPESLVRKALSQNLEALWQPASPKKTELARILVVDDSLTTRILEQGILEAAGYRVDLASSGEEGLQKAKQARYRLFIVDLEMPGIDGLEFTRRTRSEPDLRDIPVMMVTSLGDAEHRRRAEEAGASEYVVKGEFEQASFLEKVARLLGRA